MINKKKLHIEFVKEHKKLFILLDTLVVFAFLFNWGACFITNFMVVKAIPKETEIVFKEMNPITAKISGYELHPKSVQWINLIMFRLIYWYFVILGYICLRMTVRDTRSLILLCSTIIFLCFVFGRDFFADIGQTIGMVIR